MPSAEPRISVIIPTCDRHERVALCLSHLARQQRAPDQVVLVDNGLEPVAVPPGVECLRAPARCGASQARNLGAAVAAHPWLAFLDDDDHWSDNYLADLAREIIQQPQATLHLCPLRVEGPQPLDKRFQVGRDERVLLYRNPGVVGSNLAVHRDTFLSLGGFDARLPAAEDRALGWRFVAQGQGVQVSDRRRAHLNHHEGERLSHWRSRLRGNWRFYRAHRSVMSWREQGKAMAVMALCLWQDRGWRR
ncbi:glycosyltransferase [Ectothiorhodospira haloalkaliphila]|uniref:glycosyltransferase family 2 protein n=1 Tax=Ectothiorhodospira haloalkaliphila TaxID=421628 RepID=UPI001EE9436B|nr:glycosyltransferase [Ectothiorhodospira haloalkaliphila]MCG5526255.1 glycosyltransferase [Ectothiorhodospira haloalkaliphila]